MFGHGQQLNHSSFSFEQPECTVVFQTFFWVSMHNTSHRSLSSEKGQKGWNKNVEPSINSLAAPMELHRAACLPKTPSYINVIFFFFLPYVFRLVCTEHNWIPLWYYKFCPWWVVWQISVRTLSNPELLLKSLSPEGVNSVYGAIPLFKCGA